MEKMTPPPNYYGAPYPQSQMQGTTNPYQNNNQQQYGNPPYTPENNYQSQDVMPNPYEPTNTYDDLIESIKNVEHLYEVFRNNFSKSIGRKVQVFASFTDSTKWHDVVFEGTLVAIADDFMIVKSENSNRYDLISRIYVNYISFLEN